MPVFMAAVNDGAAAKKGRNAVEPSLISSRTPVGGAGGHPHGRFRSPAMLRLSAAASLILLLAPPAAADGPEQRALALTAGGPTEMSCTWASQLPFARGAVAAISWAPAAGGAPATARAAASTYSAGPVGWAGTLFHATMTGLVPGALYNYTVTDAAGAVSAPLTFRAAPAPAADAPLRVAVLADMGTVELLGFTVAQALIREHERAPFDMSLIAGDLSYATVDPPKLELQHLWDAWGDQNEPFAGTAPFLMTVGNHGAGGPGARACARAGGR